MSGMDEVLEEGDLGLDIEAEVLKALEEENEQSTESTLPPSTIAPSASSSKPIDAFPPSAAPSIPVTTASALPTTTTTTAAPPSATLPPPSSAAPSTTTDKKDKEKGTKTADKEKDSEKKAPGSGAKKTKAPAKPRKRKPADEGDNKSKKQKRDSSDDFTLGDFDEDAIFDESLLYNSSGGTSGIDALFGTASSAIPSSSSTLPSTTKPSTSGKPAVKPPVPIKGAGLSTAHGREVASKGKIPHATVKKLLDSMLGPNLKIPNSFPIVLAGCAKVLIGELVETARQVMIEWGDLPPLPANTESREYSELLDRNPIRIVHMREAWRRLKQQGKQNSTYVMGVGGAGGGMGVERVAGPPKAFRRR